MKIRRLFMAFLLAAVAASMAYAQSRDDVRIYIPPVSGGTPEQTRYFLENYTMEVSAAGYTVTNTEREADYRMRLTVTPNIVSYSDGTQGPPPPEEPQYVLELSLSRIADNVEIVSLSFNFTELEEMYEYNLFLVYQAMANVPLTRLTGGSQESSPIWNTKPWYFGGAIYLSPRFYRGDFTAYFTGSGAGLFAEFHFLRFLALGTGIEASLDDIPHSSNFGDEYWNIVLQVPLRLYAVLQPGRFLIQPYIGAAYNYAFLPYTIPPLFSWQAGLQTALKTGPGAFFLDLRYSMDIGKSGLDKTRPVLTVQYDRYMIFLGIGYKLGVPL